MTKNTTGFLKMIFLEFKNQRIFFYMNVILFGNVYILDRGADLLCLIGFFVSEDL